ncbi:MAG: hypothetical protein FWF81_06175, partial [Defluviitaleaceae bacterium]|nr:hypothetical protein [Defluviitaleaceae bacterium]
MIFAEGKKISYPCEQKNRGILRVFLRMIFAEGKKILISMGATPPSPLATVGKAHFRSAAVGG